MSSGRPEPIGMLVGRAREAQRRWANVPISQRLTQLRRLRELIAARWPELTQAFDRPSNRIGADTLACEILPLAEACRFLEREAEALLRPRPIGPARTPFWLFGCSAEIRREPLGVVLVVGPSNYPLFIPGVQMIQGLAAGNAVVLKPGRGGHAPMEALLRLVTDCGIDPGLTPLLGEDSEAGKQAIAAGVDKVLLTGSSETGAKVLTDLAPQLTPAVMELSGNDPVFILDGADLDMAAAGIAYGLRLNGSATCIAPRRVYLPKVLESELLQRLTSYVAEMPAVPIEPATARHISVLLREAVAEGACLIGGQLPIPANCPVVLVTGVKPTAEITRSAAFAPVIALISTSSPAEALAQAALSPYALGASVFGPRRAAEALAAEVRAGIVTINDIIVPSADPRLPFGGRGRSGFGSTRGREGFLEMTAIKTIVVRRGRFRPHYRALRDKDTALLGHALQAAHSAGAAIRAGAAARLLIGVARWHWQSRPPSLKPSLQSSSRCRE